MGLSMHPCGAPMLGISVVKVLQVQNPVAQGGVQTQGAELSDEFGGHYGVEG